MVMKKCSKSFGSTMEIPDEKFNNLGGLKPGGCQQTPEYCLHLNLVIRRSDVVDIICCSTTVAAICTSNSISTS
jgi:hypothetical protein